MECKKTKHYLTEYFYDTPDRERVEFLESHFASCPDCRQFRAKYESTLDLVDKREKIETNDVFWTDFEARLEQNLREETLPVLSSEETSGLGQRLKRVLEHIQEGISMNTGEPLFRPVLIKSALMVIVFITVIWVGIKISPEISNNKKQLITVPNQSVKTNVAVNKTQNGTMDINDCILLTEILDQETDLDIMQELVAEEEIDQLLEPEKDSTSA